MNRVRDLSILLHVAWEKVPFFVLSALSSVVTVLAQQSGGALTPLDKLPLDVRIVNALVSYVGYIAKMIWPVHLAVIYPHPGMLPVWQALAASVLLVSISVVVIRAARAYPYLPVGWLWYLGTLVPVIGVVQVGKQSMADRYTYIPLIGLFIIVAWGLADLAARWRSYRLLPAAFTGLLVVALAVCTWFQVRHWQNGVALFEHALSVTSNNYLAHDNLGVALARQGRFEEAVAQFSKALEMRPNCAWAHNNLGALLARQGNLNGAMGHFVKALEIEPDLADAHTSLGLALAQQGNLKEAVHHFSKALQIKPDNAEVLNDMGVALAQQGDLKGAIRNFSMALEIKPDNAEVRSNLARALRLTNTSDTVQNTSSER